MKKIILLFLLCFVQICVYAQELTLSDAQNSGCMHGTRARANENEKSRTIILTKEGNILTVQLLGYEATCDIEDFIITPSVIDGSPCSVIIKVEYIDNDEDCICPYNISFTIHELESSCFRFSCWWYNGLVNLTEGEALVLEDIKENISIDGTIYTLDKVALTAKLIRKETGESEVDIPSELSYDGQKYTVTGIGSYVFHSNAALTSITIPGSITYIGEAAFYGCSNLKEVCCQADDAPGTGSWVFDNTPIASATLHVPAGSIEEYKTTSPWSNFGNIVALSLDLTQIRIKDRPGETLEYIGKIGSDFDTALDSLRILKNISSEIEKEPLEVLFDYDDRLFFGIIYGDCAMYSDVLDTEGYYYLRTWYSPEEPHQPQSFLEGNPIWVYKYEHIPRGLIWRDGHWVDDCWVDISDRHFTYYFLGNQKEIDGKVYTMMGAVIRDREGGITLNRWLPVREENGIVYAITDSLPGIAVDDDIVYYDEDNPIPYLQQENECVLYNFGAEIGDLLFPQNEGSKVKSFDTYQLLDGTECRVMKTNWGRYDLYEKIGFLSDDFAGIMDPLLSSVIPIPINGSVCSSRLNAYYQGNTMLYKATDAPEGLCVNDTCWTCDDAEAYAVTYKADPRQEEVFAYIRQLQKEKEPVSFTAGQMATIILPTEPDASKGKYYRLDRYEDGQIIFEQELQPQAHIPYIIVPNEDFSIDLSALDLAGCYRDTVSIAGISFIGSYVSETFDYPDGFYIDFIDITHDCRFEESCVIGALRAYLLVRWDDPYNQGGTRVPPLNKRGIVLRDYETGITSPLGETGEATLYDLQGRMLPSKPAQGIYIKNRKKVMVK